MKLFLIRHGQTTANLERTYAGHKDVPLTEQGRQEALSIRPVLANFTFDRVFSSDLSRAAETQQLALPGYTAEQTPLLREFDMGSLTGRHIPDVIAEYGIQIRQTRHYSPFGGEDSEDVVARVRQFLKPIEENPCDYAAAFVHNGVINAMLQNVLGTEFDCTAAHSNNCAINVFEYKDGKWKLLAWNYMGKV